MKAQNKAVISIASGQNVCPCPAINNILTAATDYDVITFPAVDGVTAGAAVNRVITGKALDKFGCCYSTVTDFARLRGWSTSVPLATAA